jgi:hypothetical protein
MSLLTGFGLFSVTAMLVCYALEKKSPWFILGFAGACALGSVYGFLQGAWPFGVVESVWGVVAGRCWLQSRTERTERKVAEASSRAGHGLPQHFVVSMPIANKQNRPVIEN